ncbi:MAG: hypothetical protein PUE21_01940 [Lachnospiraceae bacterium]|nr:hypothetical protein [Lachnospiraceae bacterium]
MEIQQEIKKDYKIARRKRLIIGILIFVILLLCLTPAFFYFKIQTEANVALREAKNVKLAFTMLSVEFYGTNQSVYSPSHKDGISPKVLERVLETTQNKGRVRIEAYNKAQRSVEAFDYETDQFLVKYYIDESGVEYYDVIYLWKVKSLNKRSISDGTL